MSESVPPGPDQYNQDGLVTIHNHDFMESSTFKAAYQRGVKAAGTDYHWHWRVHIGLWAAALTSKLAGDFVECGVNRGFLSSAIMQFLDWDSLGKQFYLLDTFRGIDERYVSNEELASGVMEKSKAAIDSGFYVVGSQSVKANFSEWKNTRIIEGAIPETLPEVAACQIAFCHIDMNCSPPEVAALSCFWDRLVPGAMVLLDDYAYYGYKPSKDGMDRFAEEKGVMIASLPTGQGLLVKTQSPERT
jgi:hypothetical protein